MLKVHDITQFMESFAPARLAEDWDNVGLLVGDCSAEVGAVMTCLTVTPASAAEAIERGAQLIVTHHPLPFRPLKRITTGDTPGRMLWELIQAGVAVYSPHTAFDSAAEGINQRLAQGLQLDNITPLQPADGDIDGLGAGRYGRLNGPLRLTEFIARVKQFLSVAGLHVVARPDAQVQNVAVACGSAGQFLASAIAADCDTLVTGETNFHTCLEAEAQGFTLVLPGHYASERFAVESLAEVLASEFPDVEIWASQQERDPLAWV